MSSFDISIGGLQAQAAAIQVTSNNVANASTVGYKARESLFVDQYFKAVQSGGVAGAADAGAKRDTTQGTLKGTSSVLDLAVQGQGMFRLSSEVGGDNANNYYSRNGSFSVNKDGYIVNANGLFLTGYQANDTLTGVSTKLGGLMAPPAAIAPVASTAAKVVANLDTRVTGPLLVVGGVTTDTPKTFRPADTTTFNHSTTVQVYDSKGLAHEVSLFFKKVGSTVVEDPRSLTTPKAEATAVQYELYMQADGVTMSATAAGNSGAATLGNAATTAAATTQALATAYDNAAAKADAAARAFDVADAAYRSRESAEQSAVGSLAAVATIPLSAIAAAKTLGGDGKTLSNTDASDAMESANVLVTSAATLVEKRKGLAASLAALEGATDSNKAELEGNYTTAVVAEATAFKDFEEARNEFFADPAGAKPSPADAIKNSPDARVALAAIQGCQTAAGELRDAGERLDDALTNRTDADNDATAAAAAFNGAVAKTRVATLQFVDGKLLGSLTRVSGTDKPANPLTVQADLADSNGIPLFGVALDLSNISAYGAAYQVTENKADGYAAGSLADMGIDETGKVSGQYTNGMSLVAGQVVLATFNSEAGLDPASGSVFTATFASGDPVLGTGSSSSFGAVRSRSLEQSTTDMAAELVNLMVQQRNYQANSQGLQAANMLLTTAINLGR
jgi:flagellar hook protein FlgE